MDPTAVALTAFILAASGFYVIRFGIRHILLWLTIDSPSRRNKESDVTQKLRKIEQEKLAEKSRLAREKREAIAWRNQQKHDKAVFRENWERDFAALLPDNEQADLALATINERRLIWGVRAQWVDTKKSH